MGESELRGPLVQYNIYYQRTASNEPQRASSGGDKQGKGKAQFDNRQYITGQRHRIKFFEAYP